jgi:hypothetical protein
VADWKELGALSEVRQRMRDFTLLEPGVTNMLRQMSSDSATQQMLRMQESIAAAIKERRFYFPQPLRFISEFTDSVGQIRRSLSEAGLARPFTDEALRAFSAIDERVKQMERFTIPRFEPPGIQGWKFPELPQIDWDAITQRQREGAIQLANKGWTIAAWMGLRDVSSLGSATESEIEEYFLKNYLGEEGDAGELHETSRTLLASNELSKWRGLLEEVFECLEGKRYRVCVPSLLTILEGFTMESLQRKQRINRKSRKVRTAVENASWHQQSDFIGVMWMSVVTFFEHLFADSDFDSEAPTFINRHWVLHGRSATDWTAADALKLVNALATLQWFFS